LGACKQDTIQKQILKRHGKATTKIVDLIKTSTSIGHCAIFVNAEGGEDSARVTNHIPWYPAAPLIMDTNGNLKHTSLPDIILFPKIDSSQVPSPPSTAESNTAALEISAAAPFTPSTRQKHIILLDITYTDDLKVAERYQQKLDHNQLYLAHLRGLGWKPKFYPIVLTYSGCATLSLRILLKSDCGFTIRAAVVQAYLQLQFYTNVHSVSSQTETSLKPLTASWYWLDLNVTLI